MSNAAQEEEAPLKGGPAADLSGLDAAFISGKEETLREALRTLRPADLGADLSRRRIDQAAQIAGLLDERRASLMLRSAHPSVAAEVLVRCDPARAGRILHLMPTEPEVQILAALDETRRGALEKCLDPEDRANVDRILRYDESAVGRLMTPMIWKMPKEATAGTAIAFLRDHGDEIEVAANCYVTSGPYLVGVLALREVAVMTPETPLESVMVKDVIVVKESATRAEAAEIVRKHDFLSVPVIDEDNRLVGAVRVDDILDAALAKVGKGLLNQGGVAGKIGARLPYFQMPLHSVVRSRITWLVLLFLAETATGTVLRHFENELAKVVALSFFIPLLIGTGGNAGSQTVSTIIRALAVGEIRRGDVLRVVAREATTGLALGLLVGAIGFGRALLWGVDMDLAACVAITILVVCIWANTVGAVIPLLADKLRIDPTVVSGPMITTLVDATGLFLYFSVASLLVAGLRQ